MTTLIIHDESSEKWEALKAFLTALKIKFDIAPKSTDNATDAGFYIEELEDRPSWADDADRQIEEYKKNTSIGKSIDQFMTDLRNHGKKL